MRNNAGWFAFLLLAGLLLGFGLSRIEPRADAQSVDNKTTRWLGASVSYGQAQDAFVLFDSQTNRLIAYGISPTRELELIAVREISYDMKLSSFGKQKPGVLDIKKAWEDEERKDKKEDK